MFKVLCILLLACGRPAPCIAAVFPCTDIVKWSSIKDNLTSNLVDTKQYKELSSILSKETTLENKIKTLNNFINAHVTYKSDLENYNQKDKWALPKETFARGGDCEDIAIAKFALIKTLKLPVRNLQVCIVDSSFGTHAVTTMFIKDKKVVLDNQEKSGEYKTHYCVDEENLYVR